MLITCTRSFLLSTSPDGSPISAVPGLDYEVSDVFGTERIGSLQAFPADSRQAAEFKSALAKEQADADASAKASKK